MTYYSCKNFTGGSRKLLPPEMGIKIIHITERKLSMLRSIVGLLIRPGIYMAILVLLIIIGETFKPNANSDLLFFVLGIMYVFIIKCISPHIHFIAYKYVTESIIPILDLSKDTGWEELWDEFYIVKDIPKTEDNITNILNFVRTMYDVQGIIILGFTPDNIAIRNMEYPLTHLLFRCYSEDIEVLTFEGGMKWKKND